MLRRLAERDVAARVVRHGVVDPSVVAGLYDAADVFVLASTVEPYGIVDAEAMAAGLPLVGWRAGNLPNLVEDGVEARLLRPGGVDELTAALAELAGDASMRATLGAAAARRAAHLPTWTNTAEQFLAVCRKAVGSTQRVVPRGRLAVDDGGLLVSSARADESVDESAEENERGSPCP